MTKGIHGALGRRWCCVSAPGLRTGGIMNPYLRSSSADVLQRAHSQLSQRSASTAASAAPAASAQPAPSLQQLMRDDPVRAAAAHAAAALHVADRSMGAQRAQVAPP
eukprot:COSAG06_NODE_9238_length_1949_cov_34.450811_3_plen_106_part_01